MTSGDHGLPPDPRQDGGAEARRTTPIALRVVRTLVLAFVGAMLFLVLGEERFIYYPSREMDGSPEEFGLRADAFDVRTADGETIHGWWIRVPDPALTLLVSHGNAGTIADRLYRARWLQERFAVDVVLYDYRGYGRSTGAPNERGTYEDGRAVYEHVRSKGVAAERIVLFGESLGCAISIQLATEKPHAALVLEAPFLSIAAMAREVFPMFPLGPFVRNQYDNLAKAPGLPRPALVMSGDRDEVIPFEHGRTLGAALRAPGSRFVPVPGARHNDVYIAGSDVVEREMTAFLSALTGPISIRAGALSGRKTGA
jgi:hypothetical protein